MAKKLNKKIGKKNKIKKISCSILLLVLIFVFSCFVVSAAVDTKMKIKYCEFALSDITVSEWKFKDPTNPNYTDESDVFKPWNSTEQEGIFMRSDNLKQNFGENSSYNITRHTEERAWFNGFGSDGTNSSIPIINVGAGGNKWIYTRCRFKVGNYRIFLHDYGYYDFGYLTNDFNLTTDIIPYDTQSSSIPHVSKFGTWVTFAGDVAGTHKHSVNNRVNPGESDFFPYTEPYIIYRTTNLAQRPTSYVLFDMWWLVRELGRVELVSSPLPPPNNSILYINNSNSTFAVENFLKPTALGSFITRKDENTGASLKGYQVDLNIIPGHNYSITVPFNNTYNTPINVSINYFIAPNDWAWSRGVGRPGALPLFPYQNITYTTLEIPPGEIKNLTNSFVFPDNYSIVNAFQVTFYVNEKDPLNSSNYAKIWPFIGSDSYPYLGFLAIDPRITLRRISGRYEPIFNITVELYPQAYTYNLGIQQDDYILEGRIYNSSSYFVFKQNYSLPSNLAKGSVTPFSWYVPVNTSWTGRHYVKLLANMTKSLSPHGDFKDKIISVYPGQPYFKPGDIAYQLDNVLNFGNDSRIDVESVIVFNPSFYENDINLSVGSWSDTENFKISWDGVNFGKAPTKTIHLYPLQMKEIVFYVNATYQPWVSAPLIESLEIKAQAFIKTDETTGENVETRLNFILNVSNLNINWFNLVPLGYSPDFIFLDNINEVKNENIIVSWIAGGGDSGFNNKKGTKYFVNVTLINESDSSVLAKTGKIFTVSENWKTESLALNYDFSYGDYLINLTLDSNNSINEYDSSGKEGESDNYNEYDLPIIVSGCYYNRSDGNMYYYNFWGELEKDDCSRCTCPYDLICVEGLGYCANPSGECNYDNIVECNNLTAHIDEACGWECDNGNCPPNPDITDGDCKNCSSIFDGCAGYNNNVTCDIDPCYKAGTTDCVWLNCNTNEEYYCYWDYEPNENKCKFRGYIDGNLCNYSANILNGCKEGKDIMIINYTGFPTANCPSKLVKYPCYRGVKLTFFTIASLIAAVIVIIIIYLIFFRKKKKLKTAKNRNIKKKKRR